MATLLDTSFLIAYHNKSDRHHERAREIDPENPLINDYVYTEVLNVLQSRNSHRKAVDYGKFLRHSMRILRVSEPVFQRSVENFSEKEMSFTDASVAATPQTLGIEKVASFDEDLECFEKFKRLA